MSFKDKYAYYKSFFEDHLVKILDCYCGEENVLNEAIKYSIIDAGKRVRPVLMYSVCEALGGNIEDLIEHSIALEMIHTYSLVHDDLPCMDNDDYRRGKLSTHKKFGEDIGVLTGDALLNLAFEVVLNKNNFSTKDALSLSLLSKFAGSKGMIKGQILDLQSEKSVDFNEKLLLDIYHNKTAKLITAPILIASVCCNKKYFNELSEFGYNLGILFQFIDDVMDVESDFSKMGKTPNKDKEVDKLTSIKIYGLEETKKKCKEYHEKCIDILEKIPNNEFLIDFTYYMLNRKS